MKKICELLVKNKTWYRGFAFGLALAVTLTSFKSVKAGIADGTEAAIEAFALFLGLGNEAIYPSDEEFDEASLVEKVNYLKDKVEALESGPGGTSGNVTFQYSSWDEIGKACREGKAREYFRVGDTKAVKMTSLDYEKTIERGCTYTGYVMVTIVDIPSSGTEIICMVTDYGEFAFRYVMNQTKTNKGSWEKSYLRSWLNESYYNCLPQELRNNIVKSTVYTEMSCDTASATKTMDYLYLPSYGELTGKTDVLYCDGPRYVNRLAYFTDKNNFNLGSDAIRSAEKWYTRTPSASNTYVDNTGTHTPKTESFYSMSNSGTVYRTVAHTALCVYPMFKVGK